MKISEYFNPEQHLTLHQDKEGNMIGGGYQVNNLLYQRKMPLFVSLGNSGGQGAMSGGAEAGAEASADDCENRHFIPEKFSDLFRDLAVPAGLFMMPPQFRPRNYAFEVPEEDATIPREKKHGDGDGDGDRDRDSSSDSDSSSDDDDRKTVPTDIFDTLLSLVTPTDRIQHDVKTRRQRQKTQQQQHPNKADKKRQNKTRRARA